MKNLPAFLFCLLSLIQLSLCAQTTNFKGIVLDENGDALEDVQVHLLNTTFTRFTNASGEFLFEQVPGGSYVILFKKVGFADLSSEVTISEDTKNFEVTLQPNWNQLGNIVVTAQKREEVIQEIPLSITSLSYDDVKESQIQNANDLTAISPNLYAADPGDRRTVTSVRGIVSTSYDPAVATYIDGVNQFNLDTYITQLFDIERIEVLRGPQGTLYGRNAMGGVINIVTREPKNKTSVFAEATFGNYNLERFLAGVRTPLTKNLFFGAAGLYEQRDGFYTNSFTGNSYDDQQNFSGNYYLKYLFSPTWSATLNFKHFSAENDGAFPLNMGVEAAFENPYTLNQNDISTMHDNTFNTSLMIDHKGGTLNFSSHTAFQKNYRYYKNPIDADFSPLDAMSIINDYGKDWNNVKVLTQELRFSSPAKPEKKIDWTAGSYMFYQESPVKQATHFGEDAGAMGSEETNFSLINTSTGTAKGIAFFGQVDYQVANKLDLIAGLRYDHEYKKQSVLGEYQPDSSPLPVFEFQPDSTATASFNALSPKAGFTYELAEKNLLFFTYSRGFRAGGLTPLSADPSQPPLYRFKPEYSNNFELGSKTAFFEDKFLLNATLFYTTVNDVQVPTLVLPEGVIITRNTGKLDSKGVEVEFKALPAAGLQLEYDFGFTDASYDSLLLAQNGEEVDLKNNKQIFTPEVTSMLALQYSSNFGFGEDWEFLARAEWEYLGEQYFDLANRIKQEPYSLYNGLLGLTYKDFELLLWGRNLFNKEYISYAYNFGAVHLGKPATLGLTISVNLL